MMPDGRTNAPILDAYGVGDGQCAVWCKHCGYWHVHGSCNTVLHVAAHCAWLHPMEAPPDSSGNSPYLETGYWLKPAGPATPEILRDVRGIPPREPVRH